MQLGIFAKTFPGKTADAVLGKVRNAGFSSAQYNMACSGLASMPANITSSNCADISNASKSHDVNLAAMSATYNMIHPDPEIRQDGHRKLATLGNAANTMNIKLLTLCTGTRDPDDQWQFHRDNSSLAAWKDLLASMEVALEIADRMDLYLGVEPELANVVNSAEQAKRLIDELHSPRLKIIFDPANLFETGPLAQQRLIVSRALEILAPHLAMAHAKDRNPDGSFATAGKGVLDYAHFLKELHSSGFSGPLVAHGLGAEEAPQVGDFLRLQLQKLGVSL